MRTIKTVNIEDVYAYSKSGTEHCRNTLNSFLCAILCPLWWIYNLVVTYRMSCLQSIFVTICSIFPSAGKYGLST